MNRIREKKAFWIGGSIVAFTGVALVRFLSPELTGIMSRTALVIGYLLVIAGITVIACATRRKESEAYIPSPEKEYLRDGQ